LAGGTPAGSPEEIQGRHAAARLIVVQMVVDPDPLAVLMTQPLHDHPLGHAAVVPSQGGTPLLEHFIDGTPDRVDGLRQFLFSGRYNHAGVFAIVSA
jgi:hypothetical protein